MKLLLPVALATIIAACSFSKQAAKQANDKQDDRVGTCATAPQLVKPNNMPPADGRFY